MLPPLISKLCSDVDIPVELVLLLLLLLLLLLPLVTTVGCVDCSNMLLLLLANAKLFGGNAPTGACSVSEEDIRLLLPAQLASNCICCCCCCCVTAATAAAVTDADCSDCACVAAAAAAADVGAGANVDNMLCCCCCIVVVCCCCCCCVWLGDFGEWLLIKLWLFNACEDRCNTPAPGPAAAAAAAAVVCCGWCCNGEWCK